MVDPSSSPGSDPDSGAESESSLASESDTDRTTIRSGRKFEEEYRLDTDEAGEFLIELGEQLREGDEVQLVTDEWELPFAFGEPIELEIDFDGVDEPELEIELELPGRTDEKAPNVK